MAICSYHCDSCKEEFLSFVSIEETVCSKCNSADNIKRLYSIGQTIKVLSEEKQPVGSIVVDFLRETKKELIEEKKNMSKEYEPK